MKAAYARLYRVKVSYSVRKVKAAYARLDRVKVSQSARKMKATGSPR